MIETSPSDASALSDAPQAALPATVAFVSGKGGVGKTMLAVAFARELSSTGRTLVVDLDFFNRGLTALMRAGRIIGKVTPPGFLSSSEQSADWSIAEVAVNLYHVCYPHLSQREMQLFEELDVHRLRDSLSEWLHAITTTHNIQRVVLDCHGGPDNSSFAACLLADFALLVSEPDRVTFFGTLNFLRTLQTIDGSETVDVRLVFNKVIPAFSGFFLHTLYNREMRPLLNGRPLAAVFPMEIYLTKAFEKTPFLTTAYPESLLTRKTRLLIRDLSIGAPGALIRRAVNWLWIPRGLFLRYSLGKPFFLFNREVAMVLTILYVLALSGWKVLSDEAGRADREKFATTLDHLVVYVFAAMGQPIDLALATRDEKPLTWFGDFAPCARGSMTITECLARPNFGPPEKFVSALRDRIWDLGLGSLAGVGHSDSGAQSSLDVRKAVLARWGPYLSGPGALDSADAQRVLSALREKELEPGFRRELERLAVPPSVLTRLSLVLRDSYATVPLEMVEAGLVLWFLVTLLIDWSKMLVREITFDASLRQYTKMAFAACGLQLIWLLPMIGLGRSVKLGGTLALWRTPNLTGAIALSIMASVLIILIALQIARTYREIAFEKQRVAAIVRLFLLAFNAALFGWSTTHFSA